jgi:hypothetical protein
MSDTVPTQATPSLDDGFALMKTIYEAGFGVKFLAIREPEDIMAVAIPLKGMRPTGGRYDGIEGYAWWARLTDLVAPHGVVPHRDHDAITFAPVDSAIESQAHAPGEPR